MLSGLLAALLSAAPVEEGDRPAFPLQVNFSFSAGAGTSVLMRGHLALAGSVGTLHFDEKGRGSAHLFGIGAYGFLEQPAVGVCQPRCARMGLGPLLRYGFARRFGPVLQ